MLEMKTIMAHLSRLSGADLFAIPTPTVGETKESNQQFRSLRNGVVSFSGSPNFRSLRNGGLILLGVSLGHCLESLEGLNRN